MAGAAGRQTAAAEPASSVVELAHDLRSPLTSILLLVDHMRSGRCGPLTHDLARHLDTVREAASGVSAIVSSVAGHGGTSVEHDVSLGAPRPRGSLQGVLREVLASVRPLAEAQGRSVLVEAPSSELTLGCHDALRRVLLNLLDNAVKHSTIGDVTLTVSTGPSGALRVVIADDGHAASAERDIVPLPSSRGLGLRIVEQLLDTLDSKLYRADCENGGLMYWFDIPGSRL